MNPRTRRLCFALAVGLAAAQAWGNGGAFFADADNGLWQSQQQGTIYFGDVRDADGQAVARATVTIAMPERRLIYQVRTNAKGHYRSGDVGLDVDPSKVVLSVEKAAFRLAKTIALSKATAKGEAVETDFIVEPVTSGVAQTASLDGNKGR